MPKRGGRGRGLAALIPPSAPVPERGPEAEETPDGGDIPASPPAVSLVPAPPSTSPLSAPAQPSARPAPAREPGGSLGVPGAQPRQGSVPGRLPNPKQPRQ